VSLLIDQVPESAMVGPAELKAYLMTAGWNLVREDAASASELWEAEADGSQRVQVLLPLDPTFIDYRRRLSDSLQRLCDVYNWDLTQLLRSVQAIRSDLIFIRADQSTRFDSIPLRQAEQLIHGTVQMLQAAAWSTVSPRASLVGRKPEAVRQFLEEDLRMGHTQRGSFILTVLSRVDEPTEVKSETAPQLIAIKNEPTPEENEDLVRLAATPSAVDMTEKKLDASLQREETQFVLPPFQRRVVSTLATSLEETKNLTETDFSSGRMELSVGRGVSAQLCESLSEMTKYEGLRGLEISFQWAPLRAFVHPQISSVSIDRDNIGELDELKERFRAREEKPDSRVTIYGRVIRLERATPEYRVKSGREDIEAIVTIAGVVGRKTPRQARVDVSGEFHQIAIRSYERQQLITATGELRRETSGYWLRGDISFTE
jgi:hypothetical protein